MLENYDDILTLPEAASVLRIGHTHTYRLLRSGSLKGYKEGKNWKISKISLENYIREKSNAPLLY